MNAHKSFPAAVEVKNADRGEVSAVFSTFGVVDKEGDVTLPGAIEDGAEVVISSYGHTSWSGGLPVGEGRIRTTDSEAILDGRFFLDTQAGKDTFRVIKQLGEKQEWSYGFQIEDAADETRDGVPVRVLKSLKVFEVSPVLVGAGQNTRTLMVKAADEKERPVLYKAAIRPHSTRATAREWDAAAVVDAVADDASVSDLRSMYAWVDGNADPETKSAYRFPHHHGPGGLANVRACVAGIAALNGARGGTSIPDEDRRGVYEHLAKHLRDADREPPELRDSGAQQKNIDRLTGLLDELSEVVESIREVGSSRASRGKQLSALTYEALGWAEDDMTRVLSDVRALQREPREAIASEYVRFLAQQYGKATQ